MFITNEAKNHKFDKPLLGPFEILEIPSDQYIVIQKDGKTKKIHKNRTKRANTATNTPDEPTPSTSTNISNDKERNQRKKKTTQTTNTINVENGAQFPIHHEEISKTDEIILDCINTFY